MNFNTNESLEKKLEKNKQNEFLEERKVLSNDELKEINNPFGNFNPEDQDIKLTEAKAAEEADKDFDEDDYDLEAKLEWKDTNKEPKKREDLIGSLKTHAVEHTISSTAQTATLNTLDIAATWWIATTIWVINNIDTINSASEIIEETSNEKIDDKEKDKNIDNFYKEFNEEKKLLESKWIISEVEKEFDDTNWLKHKDLLDHVASNFKIEENQNIEINKNTELNNAFDLTIAEILEKRHNQDIEKIEKLMKQLHHANNLENKFSIFLEIENLIETGEWTHWVRQAKLFEKMTQAKISEIQSTKEYAQKIAEYIIKHNIESIEAKNKLAEIYQKLNKEDKKISPDEKIEILSKVSETISNQPKNV